MSSTDDRTTSPTRAHWCRWVCPRYSLRTLFVVMTVACVVGGYWLNARVRQRNAVRRFYEVAAIRPLHLGVPRQTIGYGHDRYETPIVPKWFRPLRDLIGAEAFGDVTGVYLYSTLATDDDLRYLTDVPMVESLWLSYSKVTDPFTILPALARTATRWNANHR